MNQPLEVSDLTILCCLLSKKVYLKKEEMTKVYEEVFKNQITEPKFYDRTAGLKDAQCYSTTKDGNLILGFRGTEGVEDWLANVLIWRERLKLKGVTESDSPMVHAGFYRQFHGLFGRFKKDLEEYFQSGKKRVICTGHSLGGALATIASLYLAFEYKDQYHDLQFECYTFGAPRISGANFAEKFKNTVKISQRFVNEGDIVPAVPRSFFFDFKHVEKGWYINKNGEFHDVNKGCSNQAANFLDMHKIDLYLKRLQDYIKNHESSQTPNPLNDAV
jgi:predicted lipase